MIDIKILAKPKAGQNNSTARGITTTSGTSGDVKHATKADIATIAKNLDPNSTDWATIKKIAEEYGIDEEKFKEYLEQYGGEDFISKTEDDEAKGIISFLKGIKIGVEKLFGWNAEGDIAANNVTIEGNNQIGGDTAIGGNTTIGGGLRFGGLLEGRQAWLDNVQSSNFSGHVSTGSGWGITNDYYGRSRLTVDELYVRARAIFEELLVKKKEVTGGDQIQSCAASYINRVDFLEYNQQEGTYEVMGYETVSVPWLLGLRRMLGKLLNPTPRSQTDKAGIWSRKKKIFIGITEEQLPSVARVRCYFLAKDDDREIENWWKVGDLAYCKTLDLAKQENRFGYSGTGNVEWWRRVVNVSSQPQVIDNRSYHFFDVSYDKATNNTTTNDWLRLSDIPAQNDSVVQLGHMPSEEELHDPEMLHRAEERMNALMLEVNGAGNQDAPCVKILYGIYRYDLNECWFGGPAVRMKLSPKTGYVFYGPSFKFITQHDEERVMVDRQEIEWTQIAFDYDEGSQGGDREPVYSDDILTEQGAFVKRNDPDNVYDRNYVRKVWYLERVSHDGSIWVCQKQDTAYWVNGSGVRITDADYSALPYEQRMLCARRLEYTNQEPAVGASDWVQQVSKGGFKSRAFCRTNIDISTYHPQGGTSESPIPTSTTKTEGGQEVPVSGITWSDGAPNGEEKLWSTTAWFYPDGTHSDWTAPCRETDNKTSDIEFSPSYYQPKPPVGDTPIQEGDNTFKPGDANHGSRANGSGSAADWYDPSKDSANTHVNWSDMIWRAERKIANGEYTGTWSVSRIKGESANRIDLDNQADLVSIDGDGKVRFNRTVVVHARIFEGGSVATQNVEKAPSLTAANMKIGTNSTCTVSDIVNGIVTITWNFVKGDTGVSATTRLIEMKLRNVDYSGVFSLGTTDSEAIYQVLPNPSEVSFSLNQTNNTLTPSSISLKCGYTKDVGSGTITVYDNPTQSKIDDNNYLYYRIKASNGSWGSWTAYTGALTVSSSDTNTDYEFCISTASSAANVTDANAYEREVVPVVKDGTNGNGITSVTQTYNISKNGQSANDTTPPSNCYYGTWQTNSPAVDEEYPYLWKKETTSYRYGSDVTKYYCMGSRGDNGIDAKDAEWAYIRTKTEIAPVISGDSSYYDSQVDAEHPDGRNYKDDDHLPKVVAGTGGSLADIEDNNSGVSTKKYECTDDPKGVTDVWKYEWEIKRTKGNPDAYGNRTWNYYSGTMTLHNNLSESALVIDIDNDNDQFGTDSESRVIDAQTRTTNVTMMYGTEEQAFSSTPSISLKYDNGDSVLAAVAEAAITPVQYRNNKEYRVTVSIKATPSTATTMPFASHNGLYVDITGTCSWGTKTIRFTLEKLMSGEPGVSPIIYQLALSQKSFSYGRDANNNLIAKSNSVTVNVKRTLGDNSEILSLYDSEKTCTYGFDGTYDTYTVSTINPTVTIAPSSVGNHKKVSFQLSTGDKEEVPILTDGTNGGNGKSVSKTDKYFQATVNKTAPSTPAETSKSGWTKNAAPSDWSENKRYLWCQEDTLLSDGTTHNWSTVYLHSVWGQVGPQGDDGYTVTCEPASLVINQNDGGTYDISTSNPAYFKPKVTKGNGTTDLVTSVSVTSNYCVKSVTTGIVNVGTYSSSRGLPITGVNSTAITNKYTQGYLVLSITADDKTFSYTIPIAVNYLGTYISTIVDGKKTEIANQVITTITEDGTFVQNDQDYQQVKTAAEASETWISIVNTDAATVANYNTRISNAETNITSIQSTAGKNMLDCADGSGWIFWGDGKDANSDKSTQRVYGSNDYVSSSVFLKGGNTYVFSVYSPSGVYFYYKNCGNDPTFTKSGWVNMVARNASGTYQGYNRYYGYFNANSDAYYRIEVYSVVDFYRPQLEVGETPTSWEQTAKNYSSEIKQTADEINLSVRNDLAETGINISGTNRSITAKATHFLINNDVSSGDGFVTRQFVTNTIVENTYGSEQTFGIDTFGTLTSPTGAAIQGASLRRNTALVPVSNNSTLEYGNWFKRIYKKQGTSYTLQTVRALYDAIVLYSQLLVERTAACYIWLPPAKEIVGQELTIVNAAYGNASTPNPTVKVQIVDFNYEQLTPTWAYQNIGYGFLWPKADLTRTFYELNITDYSSITLRAVEPGFTSSYGDDSLTGEWVVMNSVKRSNN